MASKRYRIAQWGLGNVGTRALRVVIEHPQLELVALSVWSESKCGQDAGALCGAETTGIIATQGADAILAARPDCTIYMPHEADVDAMCALLESGSNIVTPCLGFNHRGTLAPDVRERLEAACAQGGSSLYSTGSTPGWGTELVPFTLLQMERRFDCLTITDYADLRTRNSPEMLFGVLSFGLPLDQVSRDRPYGTAMSTPPTFRATAEALGLPLDSLETSLELARTTKTVEIAAGRVEAGTLGAIRMGIQGIHRGRPVLRRYSTWYVSTALDPAWELQASGFRYQVEGDLPLDVTITIPVSPEVFPGVSPGLTAHPVVNAVPTVCDAPPGILHTAELPMLVPWFGE